MTNRIAEELFDSVRSDFISHLDRVSKRHGTVNPTRVGVLDDKSVENIKNNKRIDHRRIKMMTISGKGSRQYPDTMNVSLFDHSLDVGCGAARLAAHDLTQGEWDPDKLSGVLAMTMVQGFAHDPDKNYGVKSQDITIEHVQDFINTWDLDGFMRRYNVNLQASHLLTYISAVEVRSSVHSSPPGISNQFLTCARRYVRLADNLSSKYLASYTNKDINLSKEWASLKSHLQNPNAFDEYEEFAFSDVHHPFLLDRFQQQLYLACIAVANVPPLFCSLMDGTLTVYLPKKSSDEIIDMASEFLAEDLPLGTKIFVSMQGSMKISGVLLQYTLILSKLLKIHCLTRMELSSLR